VTGYDPAIAAAAIAYAMGGPGGLHVVWGVFGAVPGVSRTPPRRGLFRSEPERVRIGSWRYEVSSDGRLRAGHVVGDVVLAEELLPAEAVPMHLARALGEVAAAYGPSALPQLAAAFEVLAG
jgi:hypothetical protein